MVKKLSLSVVKTAISKAKQALVDAIQNTDLEIIDFCLVWWRLYLC